MKLKKVLTASAIAVMFLFAARDRAFAWGNTWMGAALEQMVNSARVKAGPFRYKATLQVGPAGYDSDIYFGTLDHRVPDYTFSAGPDLHVFLPLKTRVVFEISESPRYVFFLNTDRERALNNTFAGSAHAVYDRFYFRAGVGLVNARERLSTELNVNVRRKEDDVSGLAIWQASKGSSFALQYQRSKYNYGNLNPEFPDIGQGLSRTESLVSLTAYLQQQSRARFYLAGKYGSYIFAERISSFKDSRSYAVSGGVEFLPPAAGFEGLTAGMRGSVDLGYKRLDFLNPLLKDYSGLAGNAGVSVGIMKLTALRLFFSMGPQFSAYSGRTYYTQTAYGAGLSRSLTRHVLFTYDFGYSRSDYPAGDLAIGNPSVKSADQFATHSFRLGFQMRRDLELSLLANLGSRNSKLAARTSSTRVFIGFSLTYGYSAGGIVMPAGPLY